MNKIKTVLSFALSFCIFGTNAFAKYIVCEYNTSVEIKAIIDDSSGKLIGTITTNQSVNSAYHGEALLTPGTFEDRDYTYSSKKIIKDPDNQQNIPEWSLVIHANLSADLTISKKIKKAIDFDNYSLNGRSFRCKIDQD